MNKILVLLLLAACADIDFHVPVNRMQTPETKAAPLQGEVEIHYHSSHKVTLGEAFDDVIFGSATTFSEEETIESSGTIALKGEVGILPNIDLFYTANYDFPNIFGAKWQFLGATGRGEGLKAAVALGYGISDKEEGGLSYSNSSGNTTRAYDTNLELKTLDMSVLTGFRISDSLLFFSNLYYSRTKAKSLFTSDSLSDIATDGSAKTWGLLLGSRFNLEMWYITFETGYAKTSWEGKASKGNLPLGLAVGFNW